MIDVVAMPLLRGPVSFAHALLKSFLCDGHIAVDATCGNGHDTLLLAGLVGSNGHVWAFDLQKQAIDATANRLSEAGINDRVTLVQDGHEKMAQHIAKPLQAVLFNLGYLPGGDRAVITRPDTTVSALTQSLEMLAAQGVIMVTIYPGHSGGLAEQSAVENWVTSIEAKSCHCWRMVQNNVRHDSPYLLLIQKAS